VSAKASDGPATQPIGVFVLDDQEIVRRGVRASGQSLLNSRAASKVMARLLDGPGQPDPLARLTPHEYSVLTLIGEGLTNRQIGERLFIAEKTVKTYVSTLFRKLGLKQRTAAAAYAARIFKGPALKPGQHIWITDRNPGT
jgi:DNA-binding CsgD family transcriptional regulator